MLCVFFPHFSNLNTLPLSSPPSTQTKPRGGLFIFSLLIVFHLLPYDTELSPRSIQLSAADREKRQGAGENAWLTPFYSVYSKVP